MGDEPSAARRCFTQCLHDAFRLGDTNASLMKPAMLVTMSAIAVIGTIMQLVGLNWWLRMDKKSPFTSAAVVAIFWDIILLLIFVGWAIRHRRTLVRFDFLFDRYVLIQLFVIGALEAAGTLAVSYAALGTSEALQSLLTATVVPLTAVFTVFVLRYDPGITSKWGQFLSLLRWESLCGIVLIVGAVAILGFAGEDDDKKKPKTPSPADNISTTGAALHNATTMTTLHPSASGDNDSSKKSWLWAVCLLGAVFNALHFVLQGNFMEVHTLEHNIFDDDASDDGKQNFINNGGGTGGGGGGEPNESLPLVDDTDDDNLQRSPPDSRARLAAAPYVETNASARMSVDVVGAGDFAVARALHVAGASPRTKATGGGTQEDGNDAWYRYLLRSPSAMRSDDFTVKISMLFVDTFFQVVFTFFCLPFDAIPGFGPHDTVADAWSSFEVSFRGIFHDSPTGTSGYFVIFLAGFCSSHIAFAFLNHYSPTLCSMVMILASPITNILLLIAPALNAHPTSPVVWASIVSAILMAVAAVLFGRFEVLRKRRRIEQSLRF